MVRALKLEIKIKNYLEFEKNNWIKKKDTKIIKLKQDINKPDFGRA